MMVGRLLAFRNGPFLGDMLVFRGVFAAPKNDFENKKQRRFFGKTNAGHHHV